MKNTLQLKEYDQFVKAHTLKIHSKFYAYFKLLLGTHYSPFFIIYNFI